MYAPNQAKEIFDGFFDKYCSALRRGVEAKIFMGDTEQNRTVMGEFRNYLQQRAAFEEARDGIFMRLDKTHANRIRDRLMLVMKAQKNGG